MRKITKELILSFKEYLIEEEKSENTIEKYIRDITFFMAWLCGQEVTKILALDYKKELDGLSWPTGYMSKANSAGLLENVTADSSADAAIRGKVDPLLGLKENVIIGKLLPSGTGMKCYNEVDIVSTEPKISEEVLTDSSFSEIMEAVSATEEQAELLKITKSCAF